MAHTNLGGSAAKLNEVRVQEESPHPVVNGDGDGAGRGDEQKNHEEDVLWLDAFRNGTVTDLPSLREYIRREGAV